MFYKPLLLFFATLFCAGAASQPLTSEILPFDVEAVSLHFSAVKEHPGLNLTNATIVSDDLGYLWIGTQEGLVRLDGYQSKRFVAAAKGKRSLINNFVTSLAFESARRKIWIGTSSGLSVYDLRTETFINYKHDENETDSLSNNIVQAIQVDQSGRVWIGTKNGLNLYQANSDSFLSFVSNPDSKDAISHSNIQDIQQDQQGKLWIATQNGLNTFREDQTFSHFFPFGHLDDNNETIANSGLITKIAVDGDKLWLGSEQNGFVLFDPLKTKSLKDLTQQANQQLPSNSIRALMLDNKGDLWIGTSRGLAIYNPETKKLLNIIEDNFINGDIVALHQDANDIVWVGTWAKGLHQFNPRETQIGKLNLRVLGSSDDTLNSMIKGLGDDIWFANPKYLYKMQTNKGRIIKYDLNAINPAHNRAIPFLNAKAQSVYLLTSKIHLISDIGDNIEFELPLQLRDISWYSATIDSHGRLWLASQSVGIFVLSPDFRRVVHHFEIAFAGLVKQIDDSTMLIGAYDGTHWININTYQSVVHRPEEIIGMLNPNATGYHKTASGQEWMGTSGGIHLLQTSDNGKPFYQTWTRENGLPTDVLTGPLQDNQGKLWFSSTNGLIYFDPDKKTFTHFDSSLGAWTHYFIGQYLKDNDNRMFFLGPSGISIIKEDLIRTNPTPYPTVIDEFQAKNQVQIFKGKHTDILQQSMLSTTSLSLPADKRDFTFGFTTTYVSQPKKVKYFYRLVGFEDSWFGRDSEHREVTYTNLFPGNYRFEIYSLSPDGVKSEVQFVDITIDNYFYESIWFKILMGLLLGLVLYGIYRFRLHQVNHYNHLLEEEVNRRTKAIKTLANIGKDISSLLDIHELLEKLYVYLNESLEVEVLSIGIYEPHNHRIKFERTLENGVVLPTHYRPMDIKSEMAAWCIHHNKELSLKYHDERFNYIETNAGPVVGESMQTVVYIPVSSPEGEMLGCISAQSKIIDAYTDEDLEFIRTIANYTGIALDNALAHSELKKLSSTDFLTNLPNRRAFLENVQTQVKAVERSGRPLTIAVADIDHFKQVNDNFGHDCGDIVLCEIASLFSENIRAQDMVARWGGEEFMFILPETEVSGALVLLEKIRCLAENHIFQFPQKSCNVTITFGLCQYDVKSGVDEAISQADHALFRGKENGRNRVEIF